jgi:hypothetical protein
MWLATVPIAIASPALCLWLPDRRAAVFFLVAFGLAFVDWAWENWAYASTIGITSNPRINPTPRTVGTLVYLSIVTAPVLIGQLLAQRRPSTVASTQISPQLST